MSGVLPVGPAAVPGTPEASPEQARLRRACQDLEGVFVRHLFQAMRDTVPEGGAFEASPGEEMFTSMLDDALADQTAERLGRGLGETLYRQLGRRLSGAGPVPSGG